MAAQNIAQNIALGEMLHSQNLLPVRMRDVAAIRAHDECCTGLAQNLAIDQIIDQRPQFFEIDTPAQSPYRLIERVQNPLAHIHHRPALRQDKHLCGNDFTSENAADIFRPAQFGSLLAHICHGCGHQNPALRIHDKQLFEHRIADQDIVQQQLLT